MTIKYTFFFSQRQRIMIRLIVVMKREQDLLCTTSGLNSQAGFAVIGIGTDSYQAIRLSEREQPDVAIIDYHLDTIDGPGLVPVIKRKCPGMEIILISPYDDEGHIREALARGVSGYVQKSDMGILAHIIATVYVGGCIISHPVVIRAIQEPPKLPASRKNKNKNVKHRADVLFLSRTEQRIAGFINQGRSTKEMSEILSLAGGTIRNYICTMMRKTGIHTRLGMAQFIQKKYPFQSEPIPQLALPAAARGVTSGIVDRQAFLPGLSFLPGGC
jgi:DNA-binding NarL/FixJ family response regulator